MMSSLCVRNETCGSSSFAGVQSTAHNRLGKHAARAWGGSVVQPRSADAGRDGTPGSGSATASRCAIWTVFILATGLVCGSVTNAQNFQENVGFSPNHVYEPGSFGENVDVTTGNLTLTVPIGPSYSVNDLSYGVVLTYNAKVWEYGDGKGTTEALRYPYLKRDDSVFGVGWTFHEGRIYLDPNSTYPDPNSPVSRPEKAYYESPSGSITALYLDTSVPAPDNLYYSKDSSYLRAGMDPVTGGGSTSPKYVWDPMET
ncbi:MAG: hypothetical protein ACE5IK_09250 [Acidobacteriota bacterium]